MLKYINVSQNIIEPVRALFLLQKADGILLMSLDIFYIIQRKGKLK